MPITLSGTRITMSKETGKGDSWNTPFLISDLYDAAVTNGWNITKVGRATYIIDGYSIYMGSLSYVKFLDCTLIFTGYPTDKYILYGSGGMQFGEYDEVTEITSYGCVVDFNSTTSGSKRVLIYNLFDSTIKGRYYGNDYNLGTFAGVSAFGKIRNSKIMNGTTENLYNTKIDIKNSVVTGNYYGTRSPASGSIFDNTIISNSNVGVWLYLCNNVTLKNVDARGNLLSIRNQSYLNSSQENTIIGCLYDSYDNKFQKQGTESVDSYCILNIAETFNLKVTDIDGITIENANVKLFNINNDLVFEAYTDENGEIDEQIVRRIRDEIWKLSVNSYVPVRTIYNYNPFKLIIECADKQTYETTLTINESKDLEITMLDNVPPVYIQDSLDGSIVTTLLEGTIQLNQITGNVNTPVLTGIINSDLIEGTIKQ